MPRIKKNVKKNDKEAKTLPVYFGSNEPTRQVRYETLAHAVETESGHKPGVEEMRKACTCLDMKNHGGLLLDNPDTGVWTTFYQLPDNTRQYESVPGNTRQYQAIPNSARLYQTVLSNSRQYQTTPGSTNTDAVGTCFSRKYVHIRIPRLE